MKLRKLNWTKCTETDRFGRTGTVYVSGCRRYGITDEGPAAWTLIEYHGADHQAVSEHECLADAKAAAEEAIINRRQQLVDRLAPLWGRR
jgi:hypothetical protein